ncbi:MAG: iron ABC transporter permease, partial [Spirochaetales bacterium]|nr:iron ABC transporter permease [Spirochaetales bacterium]
MKAYLSKPANIITLVFLVILVMTVVLPLFSVLLDSFRVHIGEKRAVGLPTGSFTLYHWKRILTERVDDFSKINFWTPLGTSALLSAVACFVAVLLGGSVAWFITRSDLPLKKVISTVFMLPYVMPSWSIAMFWENFFKNTSLSTATNHAGMLQRLTGIIVPEWAVYGVFPTAMCLGIHYAPFAYLLIGGILRNMDANLEEAATVLKTSRFKILTKITLPIVMPALVSTILLVFSSSIASYTVPAFLNKNGSMTTISTTLRSMAGSSRTVGMGFVIAIILLLFSIGILTLNNKFTGKRKSFTTVTGKSGQVSLVKLGKARIPIIVVLLIIVLFTSILPIISFALESFMPDGKFTLYYWTTTDALSQRVNGDAQGIFRNGTIWKAYFRSLLLSLSVAFIAGTCGMLIGYAVARKRGSRLATMVSSLAFFPYLIPSLSFGAVYLSVSSSFSALYQSFFILLLVGGIKFLPFASRSGTSAMLQLSGEIEEAAIIMNTPWLKRMTHILFPIQKASFVSGYLLPFISC